MFDLAETMFSGHVFASRWHLLKPPQTHYPELMIMHRYMRQSHQVRTQLSCTNHRQLDPVSLGTTHTVLTDNTNSCSCSTTRKHTISGRGQVTIRATAGLCTEPPAPSADTVVTGGMSRVALRANTGSNAAWRPTWCYAVDSSSRTGPSCTTSTRGAKIAACASTPTSSMMSCTLSTHTPPPRTAALFRAVPAHPAGTNRMACVQSRLATAPREPHARCAHMA